MLLKNISDEVISVRLQWEEQDVLPWKIISISDNEWENLKRNYENEFKEISFVDEIIPEQEEVVIMWEWLPQELADAWKFYYDLINRELYISDWGERLKIVPDEVVEEEVAEEEENNEEVENNEEENNEEEVEENEEENNENEEKNE